MKSISGRGSSSSSGGRRRSVCPSPAATLNSSRQLTAAPPTAPEANSTREAGGKQNQKRLGTQKPALSRQLGFHFRKPPCRPEAERRRTTRRLERGSVKKKKKTLCVCNYGVSREAAARLKQRRRLFKESWRSPRADSQHRRHYQVLGGGG